MSTYSSAVEPTMHSRIKKITTSSTGTTSEETETIIDNEAKVERARGLLARLAVYPRSHLEDSIRKMIHDLATFAEDHGGQSGIFLLIQDQFCRHIGESNQLVFPVRTARQISNRFEHLRFIDEGKGLMPSEKESRELDLQDREGVKQWFFKMEDAVVEFDMLTKLLPLMFEQKYEDAPLKEIETLTAQIRRIVSVNRVWVSTQHRAIYPELVDVVSKVLHTVPENRSDGSKVETYVYDRVVKDEAAVQAALNNLAPLANCRRLRRGLREVSQVIAAFHQRHLDIVYIRPSKMRRIGDPRDGEFVNINPYAQF
jgi:hypothetical protein